MVMDACRPAKAFIEQLEARCGCTQDRHPDQGRQMVAEALAMPVLAGVCTYSIGGLGAMARQALAEYPRRSVKGRCGAITP